MTLLASMGLVKCSMIEECFLLSLPMAKAFLGLAHMTLVREVSASGLSALSSAMASGDAGSKLSVVMRCTITACIGFRMTSFSEKLVSQEGLFWSWVWSSRELAVMIKSFEAWRETARIETILPLARVMPILAIEVSMRFLSSAKLISAKTGSDGLDCTRVMSSSLLRPLVA